MLSSKFLVLLLEIYILTHLRYQSMNPQVLVTDEREGENSEKKNERKSFAAEDEH